MKYSVDKQDRYTIFQLEEGDLNSVVAPDLKAKIVTLHNEGVNNLILDLSKVRYVDESGLSAILTVDRLMKTNGSFVATGFDEPALKKLLEISRVGSFLYIASTKEEAIALVLREEQLRKPEEKEEEEEDK